MIYILIFCIIFFILNILNIIKNSKIYIKKTSSKALAPPFFRLFYTDQKIKRINKNIIYSKILFSKKYNIQGKPDFVYKRFNTYYVIELKSGAIKSDNMPHKGDLLQLVSYFLIVEDLYKCKVKKGKLIYKDYSFIVKNNKKLRKLLFETIHNMREMLQTGEGNATCSFSHCKNCLCKSVCEYYNN